jgi:hypothetical protein
VVKAEGWNRFCAARNLDPSPILEKVPGYDTLRALEERLRDRAAARGSSGHGISIEEEAAGIEQTMQAYIDTLWDLPGPGNAPV